MKLLCYYPVDYPLLLSIIHFITIIFITYYLSRIEISSGHCILRKNWLVK